MVPEIFIKTLNQTLATLFAGNSDQFDLDANGMIGLAFEDDTEVMLQADGKRKLFVATAIVNRISSGDPAFLQNSLQLNNFLLTPIDAFLALDDSGTSLQLCRVGRENVLEVGPLGDFLAELVAGVAAARNHLNDRPTEEGTTPLRLTDATFVMRG